LKRLVTEAYPSRCKQLGPLWDLRFFYHVWRRYSMVWSHSFNRWVLVFQRDLVTPLQVLLTIYKARWQHIPVLGSSVSTMNTHTHIHKTTYSLIITFIQGAYKLWISWYVLFFHILKYSNIFSNLDLWKFYVQVHPYVYTITSIIHKF
jgi:hypothetical protein